MEENYEIKQAINGIGHQFISDTVDLHEAHTLYDDDNIVPIDNINLCFVGGVSTGKSTILNAIFCEELTQCKIKRTTMIPTIYIENENNASNLTKPEVIFTTISNKNAEIIEKTESGEKLNKYVYDELKFNVGKLGIKILNGSYVNVYDIPGLNDARTKDVYYQYLDEQFTKFNIVVLLVDIHSGLNTSDEIDIVNFITRHTKYELETNDKKIYTLVVVNKADDMQLDEDDTLKLTGELSEMYEQVEKTITTEFKRHEIQEHLIGIIPLCAIDSYLYRMVKKHGKNFKLSPEQILKIGINENGKKFSTLNPTMQEKKVYDILNDETFIDTMIKLSGFSCLESTLHHFLTEIDVGKEIRKNNLLCEIQKYPKIKDILLKNETNISAIGEHVNKMKRMYHLLILIDDNMYKEFIHDFIADFHDAIKQIACFKSTCEIIEFYDKINKNIFIPYFSEFSISTDYPDYIKDLIISNIKADFNDLIYFDQLIANFDTLNVINMFNVSKLNEINMFNAINVHNMLVIIVANSSGKYTIKINTEDQSTTYNIRQLIKVLKQCDEIGVNISEFLRFIMINLYTQYDSDTLFKKLMLFQKYQEIPMYTYLQNLLQNLNVDINIIINGLKSDDLKSDNHALELYYISYEQKTQVNFVNN